MKDWFIRLLMFWIFFVVFVFILVGFVVVMMIWDFVMIDEMFDLIVISVYLVVMFEEQKSVYFWIIVIFDVLYLFVYGFLFVGMVLRYFGLLGLLFVVFSFLVIFFDLIEGVV